MTSPTLVVIDRDARTLGEIAESIRANYGRGFEAQFAIGRDLAEAREQFLGDTEYGQWVRSQNFPFTTDWGRTLRLAAENEPAVRDSLASQLASGRRPNLDKAVRAVLNPELAERTDKEETPIEPAWEALSEVLGQLRRLADNYDANTIAMAVPARKRSATAKKLRSVGTDLGRVAMTLERLEDRP